MRLNRTGNNEPCPYNASSRSACATSCWPDAVLASLLRFGRLAQNSRANTRALTIEMREGEAAQYARQNAYLRAINFIDRPPAPHYKRTHYTLGFCTLPASISTLPKKSQRTSNPTALACGYGRAGALLLANIILATTTFTFQRLVRHYRRGAIPRLFPLSRCPGRALREYFGPQWPGSRARWPRDRPRRKCPC